MGKSTERESVSRRSLLRAVAALGAAIGLSRFSIGAYREPTPEVPDHDDPTPAETEGPFFKPNSPERKNIREGMKGSLLVVEGRVLSTSGRPIPGALIDFWHCDGEGLYDNEGYRLRGHQYTDKEGRYRLETILPGVYPGRTRHIHVKAQAPKGRILTTQLYFPGEDGNRRDGLYMRALEMKLDRTAKEKLGAFDFVLT